MGIAPFYFCTQFWDISHILFFIVLVCRSHEAERQRKMKRINADKVIKTINWIANDDNCESLLEPINKGNMYVCEIYLPLVNKAIIGVGDSKIDSIDNATEQASDLIDEYLENNPNTEIENYFDGKQYILEENDNGYLSIHLLNKNDSQH